jgi:hypothetical protein
MRTSRRPASSSCGGACAPRAPAMRLRCLSSRALASAPGPDLQQAWLLAGCGAPPLAACSAVGRDPERGAGTRSQPRALQGRMLGHSATAEPVVQWCLSALSALRSGCMGQGCWQDGAVPGRQACGAALDGAARAGTRRTKAHTGSACTAHCNPARYAPKGEQVAADRRRLRNGKLAQCLSARPAAWRGSHLRDRTSYCDHTRSTPSTVTTSTRGPSRDITHPAVTQLLLLLPCTPDAPLRPR